MLNDQTAKLLAEAIVEDLFINGFGQEAQRLICVDGNEKDLGGWCRAAAQSRIEKILSGKSDAVAPIVRRERH